jgi:flagellar motor switch protein FliN/FliY
MNQWLTNKLKTHLQAAFQEIAGERVELDCIEEHPAECTFHWRQPFSPIPGAIWIAATDGSHLKGLQQTFAGLAHTFSGLLDRDVRCDGGEERPSAPGQLAWLRFDLMFSDAAVTLYAAAEPELIKAITKDAPPLDVTPDVLNDVPKTFDLLFDVELPVSVSFGRAHVALKDVLKLTTGSIVELNRAIGDPVEVIVNNCVIARGEVITIEGYFGVRIHQVISRQERLRTLK